jgi:antitoxin ParD1/3/4/toxin ParE1/3/4
VSRELVIAATAKKDLNEIWDYIARDSLDVADRVLAEIESAMLKLCDTPGIGHRRDDVKDPTLLFWKIYSYLIAYRHSPESVRIARVVSGRRDFRKLF